MNLVSKFAGYSELGLYRLWKGVMELTTTAKFRPKQFRPRLISP